jgi:hypothetical protein
VTLLGYDVPSLLGALACFLIAAGMIGLAVYAPPAAPAFALAASACFLCGVFCCCCAGLARSPRS